jgi:hypothetical protein
VVTARTSYHSRTSLDVDIVDRMLSCMADRTECCMADRTAEGMAGDATGPDAAEVETARVNTCQTFDRQAVE